ncbi:Zinc finger, GRF-type [Sesbania bispinosa]|nr:Zinc finger, GRF-type [Sesbania bispinosa]
MASSQRGGSGASEKKKMVSKCSSSSPFSWRNVCGCGEMTVLFTSNTLINPGRTFWRCPNWKKKESCDYFEWADEEVLSNQGMWRIGVVMLRRLRT